MKFLETLKALSLPRQLMLAGAVLVITVLMSLMVRGATAVPMALLYSGLGAEQAGEIVEELDKRGVAYEVRGEAIFIAEPARDATRLALARDGLPRQSVQGYELLDDVNGFSVTSEMYNAAYWRAKEGELTRTILAIPGVDAARVHIGASLRSGFSRTQAPPTASVTLTTVHDLSNDQAEAIQFLVALAVSGLNPQDVGVIDTARGMIAGPSATAAAAPAIIAETQAAQLEQKILKLLAPRVGPGNAEVSVSVDVTRAHQKTATVSFDPQSRVMRSRAVNDLNETGNTGGGAVTVASNLPQQEQAGGQGGSASTKTSSETVQYEINETRTETEVLPGEIKRVSIGVLLNAAAFGLDPAATDAAAQKEKLVGELKALILSAAGLDTARGDTVSIEIMPFQAPVAETLTPKPGLIAQLSERYFWPGLQSVLLGLVVIVLAFGVVRPMLKQSAPIDTPALNPAGDGAVPADADPLVFLNTYTRERQDDALVVLQTWLRDDQKAAVNE
jgi:flagellar M-ring protein FliF